MIPLRDQVVLVTGATDGIGRQTALEIARMGALVLVHGRNPAKSSAAVDFIAKQVPKAKLEAVAADLSMQSEAVSLAHRIRNSHPRLHVLLNNAGVFMNERVLTRDGLEMTFAVNHVAPFLLTRELLPALTHEDGARVVTVSSVAHTRGVLDFSNLQGERSFDPYGAYALSKLCNVLFTVELARRLKGTRVTANSLHPGVITTKLLKEGFGSTGASVEKGARTSIYLATSPEVESVSGEYFVDSHPEPPSAAARNPANATKLWEATEKLLNVK